MNAWLTRAVCIFFLLGAQFAIPQAIPPDAAQPSLTITPAKLEFGSQPVNSTSQPKSITLANPGTIPIDITDVFGSGIDFAFDNHCGTKLAPGASCTIETTFKPAIAGDRLGSLIVADSDPASPHHIQVTGTGK